MYYTSNALFGYVGAIQHLDIFNIWRMCSGYKKYTGAKTDLLPNLVESLPRYT